MDDKQYFLELEEQFKKILDSKAQYKLIVAGPGTGKSSFFKKTIKYYGGSQKDYLVLTFINNLEDELRKDLGDIAEIYTFHGYCHYLLRKDADLRIGLRNDFYYYPPLIELIKSDWKIINSVDAPQFVKLMRVLSINRELEFFLLRGNYYNATGYDDSVFRVYGSLKEGKTFKEKYKLVIVDEYQDFNLLETSVLKEIIRSNSALIVGDDDQALYCTLRDSDPKFIRKLFREDETFENFELPFCLRCPNAVISVFDTIVKTAKTKGLLGERIDKQFNFFPPVKGEDSEKYPKVRLVLSSIQKKSPLRANYFGRYILKEIAQIPKEEIEESYENNFPAVLIIGPSYYLNTLLPLFDHEGFSYEIRKTTETVKINISYGFECLKNDDKSNLGWRIVLEERKPDFLKKAVSKSINQGVDFINVLPEDFVAQILYEANSQEEATEEFSVAEKENDKTKPTIKLTTFEGAKGLSAQHVFILGLQNGDLPKNPSSISDIEVCKFLVALTRTRKQCHLLTTQSFGGKGVMPSEFLRWLEEKDVELIKIDKNYW